MVRQTLQRCILYCRSQLRTDCLAFAVDWALRPGQLGSWGTPRRPGDSSSPSMRCSEKKADVEELLVEACNSLLREDPTHYQHLGRFSVAAKPKHHFRVLCGTHHLQPCLGCIILSFGQPPLRHGGSLRLNY